MLFKRQLEANVAQKGTRIQGESYFLTFFHFIFIKNYYSASTPCKSIKDSPSRCTLHRSSQNTMLDCKGYILRILLKILISNEQNVRNLYI